MSANRTQVLTIRSSLARFAVSDQPSRIGRAGLTQALGRRGKVIEFKVNRREMIAAFCEASGYVMPRNFDISHQTYRFIAVDMSVTPPTLVGSSGFMESRVIDHLASLANAGRSFRIFDFKRFVELHYPGTGRKLTKGAAFDWRIGAP